MPKRRHADRVGTALAASALLFNSFNERLKSTG
jgi:hypothetical protein